MSAPVSAQRRGTDLAASEESELRERYGFAQWSPPGEVRSGVVMSRLSVPGLSLRARTDRTAFDGGITLSFGTTSRTTVLVRLAIAPDAASARSILLSYLRGVQASMVPLRDRHGADVAFGDSAGGEESTAAAFGNIALWVARTSDAGAETPSTAVVLTTLRAALGPPGTPTLVTPSLSARALPGGARVFHIDISGGPFDHVEARVRGGHLHSAARPSGLDVVANARGAVDVHLIATDAFGRSAERDLVLRGAASAEPL